MSSSENILTLGDGIAVRPQRDSDRKSVASHLNNRKIWLRLRNRIPFPYTEDDAKCWYNFSSDPKNHVRSGDWTPEGGATGPLVRTNYSITVNDEAVGSIGLDFGNDVYFRNAELGYWLSEAHWGKGVMSKVVPAFVDWAWKTFGILVRLNAETAATNPASPKCLKKAGFIFEGRREKIICKEGELIAADYWGAFRPT